MPFTITVPDIHQGPGFLWYNVQEPAAGARLLVDANGNPQGGTPVAMGASEGAAKFQFKAKLEPVQIDQETAPVDILMTAEDAQIEVTLKESSLAKIIKMLEHGTFTSGTDVGLPAGAQTYEQISVGGLVALPTAPVALISPRRGTASPTKYLIVCLYKAYGFAELDLSFTRSKESVYKVQFQGLADLARAAGDRVAQFYRQT